jgi:hypothetical protein
MFIRGTYGAYTLVWNNKWYLLGNVMGCKNFRSGMEKFGSGINIPDPQH